MKLFVRLLNDRTETIKKDLRFIQKIHQLILKSFFKENYQFVTDARQ